MPAAAVTSSETTCWASPGANRSWLAGMAEADGVADIEGDGERDVVCAGSVAAHDDSASIAASARAVAPMNLHAVT